MTLDCYLSPALVGLVVSKTLVFPRMASLPATKLTTILGGKDLPRCGGGSSCGAAGSSHSKDGQLGEPQLVFTPLYVTPVWAADTAK